MVREVMSVEIKQVDPSSPVGRTLLGGSSEEQIKRYGRDGGRTAEDLERNAATFIAAFLDRSPVGCGAVVPLEPGVGELSRIFVAATARRRGVGSAILRWLEEHSKGRYRQLVLETGVAQSESLVLYEALGYRLIPCWGKSESNPLCRCYMKHLE